MLFLVSHLLAFLIPFNLPFSPPTCFYRQSKNRCRSLSVTRRRASRGSPPNVLHAQFVLLPFAVPNARSQDLHRRLIRCPVGFVSRSIVSLSILLPEFNLLQPVAPSLFSYFPLKQSSPVHLHLEPFTKEGEKRVRGGTVEREVANCIHASFIPQSLASLHVVRAEISCTSVSSSEISTMNAVGWTSVSN
jgi:hypothetical protein